MVEVMKRTTPSPAGMPAGRVHSNENDDWLSVMQICSGKRDRMGPELTVNNVLLATAPELAEMVAVPDVSVVARPPPEIVATPVLEEVQLTAAVRSCWVPSLYVPSAVNC